MYTENILKAPLNEMVCYCSKVTKGRIIRSLRPKSRAACD